MTGRANSRADDELALWMLRERCAGRTSRAIGARIGLSQERVRVITSRIRNEDAAMSGEDVSGGYWCLPPPKIDPVEMQAMWRRGERIADIAERFGCSAPAVSKCAETLGQRRNARRRDVGENRAAWA